MELQLLIALAGCVSVVAIYFWLVRKPTATVEQSR